MHNAYTSKHAYNYSRTFNILKAVIKALHIMQVFIYDGKTGEKLGSLGGDAAHSGGIYAVSKSFVISLHQLSSIIAAQLGS